MHSCTYTLALCHTSPVPTHKFCDVVAPALIPDLHTPENIRSDGLLAPQNLLSQQC
eukprot:jgi/Botrbrau1/1296/Bobra.0063s0013.1